MTSRRPAHSLPGSFVKEKRSPFKPSFKGVGDALENISSGDEASFTKGHDDEPRRVAPMQQAQIITTTTMGTTIAATLSHSRVSSYRSQPAVSI